MQLFYAKLLAVYDALLLLPLRCNITLHIGNAAVLSCLSSPLLEHGRSALQHAGLDLLVMVHRLFASRGDLISAVKVAAHSGYVLNDRADYLARAAAASGAAPSHQRHHFHCASSLLRYISATVDGGSVQYLAAAHVTSREAFRMFRLLHDVRGRAAKPTQGLCCPAPMLQFSTWLAAWLAAAGQLAPPLSISQLHCARILTSPEWRQYAQFILRFIHRILPTRVRLMHLGQTACSTCNRCQSDVCLAMPVALRLRMCATQR